MQPLLFYAGPFGQAQWACIKKAHEEILMGFGFVELVGFEPTSGEGTACAFYMFSSACCREQIGAVRTKSAPYPAC